MLIHLILALIVVVLDRVVFRRRSTVGHSCSSFAHTGLSHVIGMDHDQCFCCSVTSLVHAMISTSTNVAL